MIVDASVAPSAGCAGFGLRFGRSNLSGGGSRELAEMRPDLLFPAATEPQATPGPPAATEPSQPAAKPVAKAQRTRKRKAAANA